MFEKSSPHERVQYTKREYEQRIYRMEDKHRRIHEELKAKRIKIQQLQKEDLEGANTFDVLYYVSSTFHQFMAGMLDNNGKRDAQDVNAHDMHLDVIRDWNEFVEDRMTLSLQAAVTNFVTKKLKYVQAEHDGELKQMKDQIKDLKQQLENAKPPWDSSHVRRSDCTL